MGFEDIGDFGGEPPQIGQTDALEFLKKSGVMGYLHHFLMDLCVLVFNLTLIQIF